MNELTSFLRRYVRQLRVLDAQSLTPADEAALPAAWRALLNLTPEERVHPTLLRWSPFYEALQQTIDLMRANLRSINVLHTERGYSLLYELRNADGEPAYYEGLAPIASLEAATTDVRVREAFTRTPAELQRFYRELHDGWNYFASRSMGLSPLNHWFMLNRYEWGILDDLGPAPIALERSLAVFTNGMGGYVCFEFRDDATRTHLWFAKQAPRLNLDFWPIVDTWTLLGLTN